MKELPILFSTAMVSAILDGSKTVTRRVIIPQPKDNYFVLQRCRGYQIVAEIKDDTIMWRPYGGAPLQPMPCEEITKHARYQKGDLLYVREAFNDWDGYNYRNPKYKATDDNYPEAAWKPSIHMPKKYARIWLEVLDVRAEKVQEITDEDAIKESCKNIFTFSILWDKLNKARGYPFDSNPYVWVYLFRRMKNGKSNT